MLRAFCILALYLAFGAASAEAPKDSTPQKETPKVEENKAKDPTVPSARMKQALTERRAEVFKEELPKLPELTLKGLVKGGESGASAMIEIKDSGTQLVRAGSEISVALSGGGSLGMKITKINADSVEIEVPALKQTLVLR
jgi:hypothetical protein